MKENIFFVARNKLVSNKLEIYYNFKGTDLN